MAHVEPSPAPEDKRATDEKEVTFQLLMDDPVKAVAKAMKSSIEQLEGGASLFVAGFGCLLMAYAAADVTILARHGFERLSSAEFLQLLLLGFVLLLAGGSFRIFLGDKQGKTEDTFQAWLRERAGKRADARIGRKAGDD